MSILEEQDRKESNLLKGGDCGENIDLID